ncbi:MAG: tRNA (5-methylaminomethyl-2-thiouridylate)-methyltransferase [Legionellales bacterium]|nr:tRNA (5-methylaminomethyl-2-thiouridylate)-methyltransferase [Legionellales bacterium]|tara:strand:- start:429 stop:1472 length:1044 start_codon:yes stop_codon:yes gene_type:complete
MTFPKRALALLSGGLDSLLAAKLIQEQGVDVEGINFFTGFCVQGHTQAIRQNNKTSPKRNGALFSAHQLGIKCHIVDVVEPYKSVVLNPKFGYGSVMNPCLDCKVFMVSRAMQFAQENGFDFIISGEVIGQRPKSQLKKYAPIVSKQSGAQDLLVRPLCAQFMPETKPERLGWIDRSLLLGITGRSRKQQIALAEKYGFEEYAQPAGGCCFLTDPNYKRKLTDLWSQKQERDYELDDILLLKVGRHIRPRPHFKLIVGREVGENRYLMGYRKQFTHFIPSSCQGAMTIVDGVLTSEEDMILAAQIAARFTQGRHAAEVTFDMTTPEGSQPITVTPLPESEIPQEWYL